MLLTRTDRRAFDDDLLLERKFDGERCLAHKAGSDVRLESRTGKDLTGTYPEVRAAVAAQAPRELCLAGEKVAAYPVVLCVFDLLAVDGDDLTGRALVDRRLQLTKAVRPSAALQLSEAWRGDSKQRFTDACRAGWEGLIAKRADAQYARGR